MKFGVFLPIANNGFLMSETAPQYIPSFELNRDITLLAEQFGFDLAFSMVKYRGYGGATEHWDHALESMTLMAGLAPVTSKIGLYASVAVLTLHPAMVARMAVTIDDISGGRFGINIVSGWNKSEYGQMGLWPSDEHFSERYPYSTEFVTILHELWESGRSSFKGKFFELDDCLCQPKPRGRIPVVCAGQSDLGLQFAAELGDYNFLVGDIETAGQLDDKVKAFARERGRTVGTYALFTVLARQTDEEANAVADQYGSGVDMGALEGFRGAAAANPKFATMRAEAFMGFPTIIGSYESVADYLNRLGAETNVDGALVCFADWIPELTAFGERVMPLIESANGSRV